MSMYKSTYHEDSDADDEYERSVITSPTVPVDFESSPTDSEPPSAQHTPTTFTHSADSYASPTGLVTKWTAEQCADWVSSLGLSQYADTFIDEAVDGEALIALQHAELKEMGMGSVGHRLTILKGVYDVKVKQNVPIEPDHYVPLSAETTAQEAAPSQDDIARIIQIIRDRDERIMTAEHELRMMKEDLHRMVDENRKLREDVLPVVRLAKDRSQPLPTPDARETDGQYLTSPPTTAQEPRSGSSLSRKFSTKKLFLGSAPKNPSPTIHEGRTLTDSSNLDPSAAAMAASNHLTASVLSAPHSGSQPSTSPHQLPQPSPTSPAYSIANRPRGHIPDDRNSAYNGWSSSASTLQHDSHRENVARGATPVPSSRRDRDRDRDTDNLNPPLSAGRHAGDSASLAPSTAPSTAATLNNSSNQPSSSSGRDNPQVEIFKSFRVSIDDPCHKVLPVALKKYNITADWRQYALYIVHGDQERCLGLNERPLILFKQLDREGRKPMFMLRKHAAPIEGHVSTIGGGAYAGGGVGGQGQGQGTLVPGGVL